jgi:hypothetical protein
MTNAMNAIANQVIRSSGRSGRNAGWPYFDGTFRDYPAFKRKFESFRTTYHRGTPTRELFQQFREMCLPEKLSVKIKSANTMENAWIRLDAWFGDQNLFIKDLMQDIKSVAPIKDGDDERVMDYYVTLQAHIEEALNISGGQISTKHLKTSIRPFFATCRLPQYPEFAKNLRSFDGFDQMSAFWSMFWFKPFQNF